ncbi:MAG TPA: PQQ-dependent sugar dehydrogenase, partial [Pyrinomonadaceae bacterium]|nr:PQQ-dependent sugar dehydrogenase [Pyrinomonadaceae bacterium]
MKSRAAKRSGQLVSIVVLLIAITVLTSSTVEVARAATVPPGFTDSLVAAGLTNPTAMALAPDGRIFVCEQAGTLRVIKNGVLLPTPFLTVTVDSSGERGLLGVAFDPNFVSNQLVYIYYTATTPTLHNRISRFIANGDVAMAGSETVIMDLNNLSTATNHNGGALHFGLDGNLYVAVGDNANGSNAQSLSTRLGKMLRITSNGGIPTDNPFFNQTTGDNRAIWALGLRNPFTFSFQPGTARMFINDVGQNTWEEINDGIAGSNYGWPNCEGFCNPPNANFRDPIFAYANDAQTCAITGGTFYNPQVVQFPSNFIGRYFFADFCGGWIKTLDPSNGNAVADFATGISLPVDLQVSADGFLYYLA